MPKEKCANCGAEMLETYARSGLRFLICSHINARIVNRINGTSFCAEIYCSINIKRLKQSFETLTKNTKLTFEALRSATRYTISDSSLLENANLALMLGLPANELSTLFKAAMQLGLTMGTTPQKAIESLCKGIGRQSKLILDNIGIVFKAREAYDFCTQQTGKTEPSATQKREAWIAYAIHLVKQKAEVLEQ